MAGRLFPLFAALFVGLWAACVAAQPNPDAVRRDRTFGNAGPGVFMEDDPVTGDRVIRADPPRQKNIDIGPQGNRSMDMGIDVLVAPRKQRPKPPLLYQPGDRP